MLEDWELEEIKRQDERERIINGYAKVSKDGEVYLDFSDQRVQKAAKDLIDRFCQLEESL